MDKRVFVQSLADSVVRMLCSVATIVLVIILVVASNSYKWYTDVLSVIVCSHSVVVFVENLRCIRVRVKEYRSYTGLNYTSMGTVGLAIKDYKSYPKK